jgi:hypothetical protein
VGWTRKFGQKDGNADLRSATSDRVKRNKSGKWFRDVNIRFGCDECWGAKNEEQARENEPSGLLKAGA